MHIDFRVYEVHAFLQHVFWIYTDFLPGVQFLLMCLDTSTHKPLTWEQRLQIALDAAQGMNELSHFWYYLYMCTIAKKI